MEPGGRPPDLRQRPVAGPGPRPGSAPEHVCRVRLVASAREDGSAPPLRLGARFDDPSHDQWRAAVDKVLGRGNADLTPDDLADRFERDLVTTTVDGLVIQPLFTDRGNAPDPGLPGFAPFIRGTTPLGAHGHGWDVRQRVLMNADTTRVSEQVLRELERGSTSVMLDLDALDGIDVDLLDAALDGAHLDMVSIALRAGPLAGAGATAMTDLWRRRSGDGSTASGTLGLDPIGRLAEGDDAHVDSGLADAVRFAETCTSDFNGVRAIAIDAALVHESGGGDVEEVGYAAATGLHYLRTLVDAGISVDDAAQQLEFRFAATPDQFLTIAKLRAARRIWQRITAVAGVSAVGQRQRQHAISSTAATSRYDIWVNLLRGTVACFGAGVGGADAVTVLPHDELLVAGGSDLGRRMARNTQIVLIEESNLARVIDIAGGSFYVEQLTDQLANAAWAFMQQIETANGVVAALRSGLVRDRVDEVRERRDEAISERRLALTGVSEFPNIADVVPEPEVDARTIDEDGDGGTSLHRLRWADPIEAQRGRADRLAAGDGRPTVFLATLGPVASHTARAGFARNLFEVGGIRAIVSDGHTDAAAVCDEFVASGASLVCVCASDSTYADLAVAVVETLRTTDPARIYLAGRPKDMDDSLAAAGVDEQIVAGGDVVGSVRRALDAIGAE